MLVLSVNEVPSIQHHVAGNVLDEVRWRLPALKSVCTFEFDFAIADNALHTMLPGMNVPSDSGEV